VISELLEGFESALQGAPLTDIGRDVFQPRLGEEVRVESISGERRVSIFVEQGSARGAPEASVGTDLGQSHVVLAVEQCVARPDDLSTLRVA
jgi:hypothetical protein